MPLSRPGIVLMGGRRSGKTSIARVIFAKVPAHETMLIEPTPAHVVRAYTVATNPYVQFTLWDWPADYAWAVKHEAAYVDHATPVASSFGVTGASFGSSGSARSRLMLPSLEGTVPAVVFGEPAEDEPGIAEGLLAGDPSAASAAPSAFAAQALSEAAVLGACGAIVVVVDATEEAPFAEAVDATRRAAAVLVALAVQRRREAADSPGLAARPLPALEVFVHKVDSDGGGGDEGRAELLREVSGALLRELREAGFLVSGAPLPPGSNAGRSAGSSSQAAPAAGLVHAAGFAAPLPLSVRFHLTSVFDYSVYEAVSRVVQGVSPGPAVAPYCEHLLNGLLAACGLEKVLLMDLVSKLFYATDSGPMHDDAGYELCADAVDVLVDVGLVYDPGAAAAAAGADGEAGSRDASVDAPPSADAGRCGTGVIRLRGSSGGGAGGTTLYLREVAPYLAVVCVARDAEPSPGADRGAAADAGGGGTAWDGDDTGGAGADAAPLATALPRSGLSLPHQATIDFNIAVVARALAALFKTVAAAAAAAEGTR